MKKKQHSSKTKTLYPVYFTVSRFTFHLKVHLRPIKSKQPHPLIHVKYLNIQIEKYICVRLSIKSFITVYYVIL